MLPDACITTSLGPRWAFTGPYMSNVLGGGGGKGGFKHLLQHLGPGIAHWVQDMRAHEYQYTDANLEKLDESVQKQLEVHDPATVEKQRDELLVKLLNDKKGASALV